MKNYLISEAIGDIAKIQRRLWLEEVQEDSRRVGTPTQEKARQLQRRAGGREKYEEVIKAFE